MTKCEECGREFSTEEALAQHLRDKHGVAGPKAKGVKSAKAPKDSKKQKSLRRQNGHARAYALIAAVVAAGIGVYFAAAPYFAQPPFAGISGESWIHVHPYLVIDIAGTNISIPAGVGILGGGSLFEPIHTHDGSGLLHIELSKSDAKSHNYTLGDFFTIWNYTAKTVGRSEAPTLKGKVLPVIFTPTNILGFRANSTYQVVLLVDGKPSTEWDSLNLEQLDYCSAVNSGSPCCPTDCTSASGPASNPLWDGPGSYPYGYGHTIVIRYQKV